MTSRILQARRALEAETKLLYSLSHRSVLARGFALVRDDAGTMVRSAGAIGDGQRLEIELADGRRKVRAEGEGPAAPAPGRPARGPSGTPGAGGQGQLF